MFPLSRNRAAVVAALAALALLCGCAGPSSPLYGPNSPRNGAGEVVDPATGVAVPGYWQEAP
jgi:hypothetical protein